jgi:hypothetical protein
LHSEWPTIVPVRLSETERELLVNVLRRSGHAPTQQQWQPIETAPKTGHDILVTCGLGHPVRIAFWDDARDGQWSVWPGRDWIEPRYWVPVPDTSSLSSPDRKAQP